MDSGLVILAATLIRPLWGHTADLTWASADRLVVTPLRTCKIVSVASAAGANFVAHPIKHVTKIEYHGEDAMTFARDKLIRSAAGLQRLTKRRLSFAFCAPARDRAVAQEPTCASMRSRR